MHSNSLKNFSSFEKKLLLVFSGSLDNFISVLSSNLVEASRIIFHSDSQRKHYCNKCRNSLRSQHSSWTLRNLTKPLVSDKSARLLWQCSPSAAPIQVSSNDPLDVWSNILWHRRKWKATTPFTIQPSFNLWFSLLIRNRGWVDSKLTKLCSFKNVKISIMILQASTRYLAADTSPSQIIKKTLDSLSGWSQTSRSTAAPVGKLLSRKFIHSERLFASFWLSFIYART